jgi:hypothetical protein
MRPLAGGYLIGDGLSDDLAGGPTQELSTRLIGGQDTAIGTGHYYGVW